MPKARIALHKTTNDAGEDIADIYFVDDASGTVFLSAQLPLLAFAKLLMGQGETAVAYTSNTARLGTRHEHKREIVSVPPAVYGRSLDQPWMTEVLKPWEVDGWKGRRSDLINGHRRVDFQQQEVTFDRFVPIDPSDDAL